MTPEDLFAFLFSFPASAGDETLARWILQSRRFQSFVVEYGTKIRKKWRSALTPESRRSLLLELDIARHLVEDSRCRVEYEKYGQSLKRSPDFTVTFRTHTCFNLEATCIQMAQEEAEERMGKLIRIVCDKVGQMVPQMLNCLVVATDGNAVTADETNAAMKSLKKRVEQRDDKLLSRTAFDTPADFFRQFQWLNAILLCAPTPENHSEPTLWTNPQARQPLPREIQTLLQTTIVLTPANDNKDCPLIKHCDQQQPC